jgi:lipopolysaccharide/colanic/teichoic acid biosynthesis glycosyltransferase
VRPGLTGPWQVHGRSDIPFEQMIQLDYTYVAAWTMREDVRLLARTCGAVLRRNGAY